MRTLICKSSADTLVNCYRDVIIFIDRIAVWDVISKQLAELVNACVWIFSRELEPQMLVRKLILYRSLRSRYNESVSVLWSIFSWPFALHKHERIKWMSATMSLLSVSDRSTVNSCPKPAQGWRHHRWTKTMQNMTALRHGLMLLWFTGLMNVTEKVTIHRPNVSTLLSSAFIRGDLNAATRGPFIWSLIGGLFSDEV